MLLPQLLHLQKTWEHSKRCGPGWPDATVSMLKYVFNIHVCCTNDVLERRVPSQFRNYKVLLPVKRAITQR